MNKDTLFKHVVAMGDKSTHGEYKSQAMTDMHREGFESWAKAEEFDIERTPIIDQYRYFPVQARWEVWQAAMRYRDEQEKQA